jgi:hypothetical protein
LKFTNELYHSLTRKIAWEAVFRIRVSFGFNQVLLLVIKFKLLCCRLPLMGTSRLRQRQLTLCCVLLSTRIKLLCMRSRRMTLPRKKHQGRLAETLLMSIFRVLCCIPLLKGRGK